MNRLVYAIDTETFPIGPDAVAPRLVSLQLAHRDATSNKVKVRVLGNGDKDQFDTINTYLDNEQLTFVSWNAKFDFAVLFFMYPELGPKIFKAYEAGRILCLIVREKLLNLSWHGSLKTTINPDGTLSRLKYDLASAVQDYLGRDRSAEKKDEDSWRQNFQLLDGKKASEYPKNALDYAAQDAIDHLLVFEAQTAKRKDLGRPVSFRTQIHRSKVDFALYLMTCRGIDTDEKKKQQVAEMCREELHSSKMQKLIKHGILRPGEPPRPHKNGAVGPDGKPRMTAAKKPSINKKKLCAFIEHVCYKNDIEVKRTEPTERCEEGQVSAKKAVLDEIAHLSPTLQEYQHRAALQKLVTTDLPRMQGKVIHPNFNVVVETGRTSSYANDKPLYPSCNIQNPHPLVRPVFKARKGFVLCSCDYSYAELCTLAQTNYDLFGHSVHRDIINQGLDPHSFLGASLAYFLDPKFHRACDKERLKDKWDWNRGFLKCEKSKDPSLQEFFATYRKLAKPTGLGYPGGLGPAKFVQYAWDNYKVRVTEEQGVQLRDLWFDTFPEMREYFQHINVGCTDSHNDGLYCYDTPMGLHRAGASYCAAANGLGLQSPTAEGATLAVWDVVRAAYDPTEKSDLKGCYPLAFIHDELLVEIPDDGYASKRANEVARRMVASFSLLTPDVTIRATPVLMRRWHKEAKQVFDAQGNLIVWKPKPL